MDLASLQKIITMYLNNDKPSCNTATKEIRKWLERLYHAGEVHSYLVTYGTGSSFVVHVSFKIHGPTHKVIYYETDWMSAPVSQLTATSTPMAKKAINLHPDFAKIKTKKKKKETPEDAYDRAMKGI